MVLDHLFIVASPFPSQGASDEAIAEVLDSTEDEVPALTEEEEEERLELLDQGFSTWTRCGKLSALDIGSFTSCN